MKKQARQEQPAPLLRGDLLLFQAKPGSLIDQLIAWGTGGPYVHVEIALGEGASVGAHPTGIVKRVLDPHELDVRNVAVVAMPEHLAPSHLAKAVRWAERQAEAAVGRRYGWTDIAFQVAKRISGGRVPFILLRVGTWDCSDFATRYLWETGVSLPDSFLDPSTVTPNDLARWATVSAIPRKKEMPTT